MLLTKPGGAGGDAMDEDREEEGEGGKGVGGTGGGVAGGGVAVKKEEGSEGEEMDIGEDEVR